MTYFRGDLVRALALAVVVLGVVLWAGSDVFDRLQVALWAETMFDSWHVHHVVGEAAGKR